MSYIAKKDFSYRTNKWKKGDPVKVGETLATLWLGVNIELKKADTKKPRKEEK